MRPIRIVVGDMPHLLRDIVVEVISSETDLKIVGEATGRTDVKKISKDTRADVVVFDDAAAADRGGTRRLVRDFRDLKLLVLSDRGKAAELHWMEPRSARCADVSPATLVELIRSSFAGRGTP